jgi:putative CocE/NonD family hydrolase
MRDGARLKADLYVPKGPGPWPVLVERTPYNKETSVELTVKSPPFFASRGYAVVFQDVRGRFKSEGEFYPFRDDGWGANRDGYDTIEWLAAQKWCNGKVATMGGSYSGHTQYSLAPTAPPHLTAQFVRESVADYHDGWVYRGGALELGFGLRWAVTHTFNNDAHLPSGSEGARVRGVLASAVKELPDWYRFLPLAQMPLLRGLSDWWYEWLAHPDDGPYWWQWNVSARHPEVETPIYHLGGWFDTFLKGTLDNFAGISSRARSPKARNGQRLIIGPWPHGPQNVSISRWGDFDFGPEAVQDFNELRLPWYDYWLKGLDSGLMAEPPARIFTMGANRWQYFDTWPPRDSREVRLYFSGGPAGSSESLNDGRLIDDVPRGIEGADSYLYDPADPVETLGGSTLGSSDPGPIDQRRVEPRCLTYTSEPLAADLEVSGRVKAVLFAMSSAPDTDWVVRLCDVHPDGASRLVAEGILRARYRESAEVQRLLTPGQVYPFEVDLWSTSNMFLTGHRVRVTVTSSCFPRWDRNLNTGGPFGLEAEGRPAINTVLRDRFRPSHIVLPVRTA